jgi:hypothetical protein
MKPIDQVVDKRLAPIRQLRPVILLLNKWLPHFPEGQYRDKASLYFHEVHGTYWVRTSTRSASIAAP